MGAIPRNCRPYVVLSALLVTLACASPGPAVIHYDVDACDHCRMTISDPVFAGQIVMRTGKTYRFDDPACLVAFVTSGRVAREEIDSFWANNHAHPSEHIKAPDAVFIVSERIRAPMNGRTAAFASRQDALAFQSLVGGQLLTWTDVLKRGSS